MRPKSLADLFARGSGKQRSQHNRLSKVRSRTNPPSGVPGEAIAVGLRTVATAFSPALRKPATAPIMLAIDEDGADGVIDR
jgi:hypothetical protein